MGRKQQPKTNSSSDPKGLPPLPPRRQSTRNVARVDDVELNERSDADVAEQSAGNTGRQQPAVATASDSVDSDEEYADSSSGEEDDEFFDCDHIEELPEDDEVAGAAEGLVELADAAAAAAAQATQQDHQLKDSSKTGRQHKKRGDGYADAR